MSHTLTAYGAAQLREAIEKGTIKNCGPDGRSCCTQECLSFVASTVRTNGGFPNGGLNIPESIQFFVGPPACGRHADFDLMTRENRSQRFYRIRLTETDLVNGTGPLKVQGYICDFLEQMEKKPKAVTLCITCVDALLNSDYSALGVILQEKYGLRFAVVEMFPFLSESIRTHSEKLIEMQYSLLQPAGERKKSVNLLGIIEPCSRESEFYKVLERAGYKINVIFECETIEEYDELGSACLNLVMVENARLAAQTMEKRFGIPYLTFYETCSPEEILENYHRLEETLGCKFDVEEAYAAVKEKAEGIAKNYSDKSIAVGQAYAYEPLKLAADLIAVGVPVKAVFTAAVRKADLEYLRYLEKNGRNIAIYQSTDPEALFYCYSPEYYDVTIGLDYSFSLRSPGTRVLKLPEQPFEFFGLHSMLEQIEQAFLGTKAETSPTEALENPFARKWTVYRKEL